MPELPEVETVRRGLAKQLAGASIKSLQVIRKESLAYPTGRQFAKLLSAKHFKSFARRGKYLLIELSENTGLIIHLRMSGRLLILDQKQAEPAHVRIRFLLADGRKLLFDDPRVFGRIWGVPAELSFEEVAPSLGSLGPEALGGLDCQSLKKVLAGKKQSIKQALLDQSIMAGIGNIYADESLFRAAILPDREAGSITYNELLVLSQEINQVLSDAIALGGSTLRDYTNTNGINGNYQNQALVYGRKNEPCRKCGSKIVQIKIAGRSSHYCPACQH